MRSIHSSNRAAFCAARAWVRYLCRQTAFVVVAIFAAAVAPAQAMAAPPCDGRAAISAQDLGEAVLSRNLGLPARTQALEAAQARATRAGALDDPMFSYGLAPGALDRSPNIFGR